MNNTESYNFLVVIFAPGNRRGPDFDTADPWVSGTTEDSLRKFREMAAYGALLFLGPRELQVDLTSRHQRLVSKEPEEADAALKSATADVEWLTANVYRKNCWCPSRKCNTHGDARDYIRKLGSFLEENPVVTKVWNRIASEVFADFNDRRRSISIIRREPTLQTVWDKTAQDLYEQGRRLPRAKIPGRKRQRR